MRYNIGFEMENMSELFKLVSSSVVIGSRIAFLWSSGLFHRTSFSCSAAKQTRSRLDGRCTGPV